MTEVFLKVVNMSISASWLVLVVIALRFLLRRSPKWINVLLWGIVAVRLICPFTIESALSLIPSTETISPKIMMDWTPEIDTGFTVLNEAVNPVITETFAPEPVASANPLQILIPVAAVIWLAGIAALLLYTLVSYFLLKRKVATAVLLRYDVFQSEYVTTPFVLGIIKPKIYLPYTMSDSDIIYVISHEKAHIRRHDHWWKPLGFLLLTVYWFNPAMWAAYKLLCKDIELACDENVIRNMSRDQRADYAQALLSCSVKPHLVSACPIAFGEVGVKTRIKSVMNYRKPGFWLVLVALTACAVLAVCFLTNPEDFARKDAEATAKDFSSVLEIVVPDKQYQDMDRETREQILSEYGDLLDDYTLIARESTDGTVSFIVGCYNGEPKDSPFASLGRYAYGDEWIQVIDTKERIEEATQGEDYGPLPGAMYTITKSCLWQEDESSLILIEPNGSLSLVFAYHQYLNPNGAEYIRDAASRGIALYSAVPWLSIYMVSEKWGMVAERIPLTDEQVSQILAEEPVVLSEDGYGFQAYMLYAADGVTQETYYGFEDIGYKGVPQTVIDLAVEKCGYRFESPADIQSDIIEARLDCEWLEKPIYADKADLPRLHALLTNPDVDVDPANPGGGYGARLTIHMADDKEMVLYKCSDERDSRGIIFGSYSEYGQTKEMNEEFWGIFGLESPDAHELPEDAYSWLKGNGSKETVPVQETTEPSEIIAPVHQEAADLAYFMELISNVTFQDMNVGKKAEILSEYGDLLDDYDLIARESTDGSLAYIVGYWGGNVEESPLYHLRSSSRGDENGEVQVLYDERDLEAADKYEEPEYKYVIHNSHINHSSQTGYFLIHPTDSGWGLNDVFNKYLRPNGREYMQDAFSRGIALAAPKGAYLEVSLISPQWGEIYEMIPLSEEQVSQIIAEDRQKLENGHGFVARLEPGPNSALNLEWDALSYTEFTGVPQTVLDLAVEKCGYTFAAPEDIKSDIVEARLDCSWLEEPVYAAETDLARLKSILKNAEFGFIGKCGYGAKLTISMEDGTEMVMFKGTDSCDTMVFGSYGGYFIGDEENTEFWDMFGIDIEVAWNQ